MAVNLGRGNGVIAPGTRKKTHTITQEQFEQQLKALPNMVDMAMLNFSVAILQRASYVTTKSFEKQRFYSNNGQKWAEITENTYRNRRCHAKRYGGSVGKRNEILREFGFLRKSFVGFGNSQNSRGLLSSQMSHSPGSIEGKIYMNNDIAKLNPHRKGFVRHVALHNEPGAGDYYNFGHVPFKKRQFMGHSTYTLTFIEDYEKRYLFDNVFGDGVHSYVQSVPYGLK